MSEKNSCCNASSDCCSKSSVIESVKEYYGKKLQSNEDLVSGACCSGGECLSGTLYTEDFRRIMAKCGWEGFRYTNIRNLELDGEVGELLGFAIFSSRTVRAFKLDDLEDICEDYGQIAYYDGSIPGHTHYFDLDDHHRLVTGKPMLVCGNTVSMLQKTRYGKAFKVIGDRSVHFGVFGSCAPEDSDNAPASGSCGC